VILNTSLVSTPFKAPLVLTSKLWIPPTQCRYVFCMILTVNSNFFVYLNTINWLIFLWWCCVLSVK
jgi:hypothetical protein